MSGFQRRGGRITLKWLLWRQTPGGLIDRYGRYVRFEREIDGSWRRIIIRMFQFGRLSLTLEAA